MRVAKLQMGKVGRILLLLLLWFMYGGLWVVHAGSSVLQWFFELFWRVPPSVQLMSTSTLLIVGAALAGVTFFERIKSGVSSLFAPLKERWRRFKSRNGYLVLTGGHGVLSIGTKGKQPALTECTDALLEALPTSSLFYAKAQLLQKQAERLAHKKEALSLALGSRFDASGLTFQKFFGGVKMAEEMMAGNTMDVIKRVWAFDEQDYAEVSREGGRIATQRTRDRLLAARGDEAQLQEREQVVKEKMALYQSAIAYVEQGVQSNEKVLLRLDRLQEEIASLSETGNVENLAAMREIETLIADTKWYRDNSA